MDEDVNKRGFKQYNQDIKTIHDFLQSESPEVLTNTAFFEAGVIAIYEDRKKSDTPIPHNIEIAYRRIMTNADCVIEEFQKLFK
jgi:hypothetical protein